MSGAANLVLDALQGRSIARVRLLYAGESPPESFEAGFDQLGQLDPNWVWIVERNGRIEGTLLASPCHGTVIIWKLALMPNAPVSSLRKLLRRFLHDCRLRGLRGYLTLVDPNIDKQSKLKKLMERAGAMAVASGWTLMAAPLLKEHS